ncbi:MAG: DUF1919 domain-containing protein [Bacilli bacterium]
MTFEGFRLKFRSLYIRLTKKMRNKKIKDKNFTIISNNCWGGMIYESYNLQKQSPTVGLFFMAKDYIKFLSHFEDYLKADLLFINPKESKYYTEVKSHLNYGNYPVGKLSIYQNGIQEDIEIFFMHYHGEQEARDKWIRRCKRINMDRLLIKFNDQNGCTEEDIVAFEELPFKNKILFSVNKYSNYKSVVTIKAPKKHSFIKASYEPFGNNKYININNLLNHL